MSAPYFKLVGKSSSDKSNRNDARTGHDKRSDSGYRSSSSRSSKKEKSHSHRHYERSSSRHREDRSYNEKIRSKRTIDSDSESTSEECKEDRIAIEVKPIPDVISEDFITAKEDKYTKKATLQRKIYTDKRNKDVEMKELQKKMKTEELDLISIEVILMTERSHLKAAAALSRFFAEANTTLFKIILTKHSRERVLDWIRETLEIEKNGGMLTKHGGRRRTVGGVFIALVRSYETSNMSESFDNLTIS